MSRNARLKLVGASLAALAVAGGGVAIAATKPWSPRAESQAVINDAAKQLGVTPTQLSNALKRALKNRVDDAVAAGLLTKAQGDALKKRIDSSSSDLPLRFGLSRFAPRANGFDFKFGLAAPFARFEAASSYLGLSESELKAQLAEGKTLAQVANDRGKSVDGLVDALVKAAEKQIDAAVANGKLTKSQADDLKAGLSARMTRLVNGELRFRRGPGPFAPGFGLRVWLPRPSLAHEALLRAALPVAQRPLRVALRESLDRGIIPRKGRGTSFEGLHPPCA